MTEIASGEIPNPPYVAYVLKIVAVCTFFVLFGVTGSVVSGGKIIVLVGMSILAIATLLVIWHREYYNRPKSVVIENGGVRMFFRYSKSRFVAWEEVRWISAPPVDPALSGGKYFRDGFLQLKGRRFFPLYWKLAQRVREAYAEQMGRYPPMSD